MRIPRPGSQTLACPACGAMEENEVFYSLQDIPAHTTLLLETRQEAEAFPTGDLELVFCSVCGFVFNALFDGAIVDYSAGYEASQAGSTVFVEFARELAGRWINRYELAGKKILEIGCGKGEFLAMMCEEGDCEGVGYDPAYSAGFGKPSANPRFVAANFDASAGQIGADFVLCRHTLEHIPDVSAFLTMLRRACGDRASIRLGFEVPDFRRILADGAFWDIYYEHCCYFTSGSLARSFARAEFEVLDLRRVYGAQYLIIEARPAAKVLEFSLPIADDVAETALLIADFRLAALERISAWRRRFAEWRASEQRIALWGSGSKAVSFLSTIGDINVVQCVVDINPRRQGKYMPSCPTPIVAPEDLPGYAPDIVIVMNAIYRSEIDARIGEMGLDAEVCTTEDDIDSEIEAHGS